MRITELMERPRSRDLLSDWYTAALEEQAASGMSMAEYADEIGVSSATLYQWRRRLARDGRHVLVDHAPEPELIEVVLGTDRASKLTSASPPSLTLQLGSRAIEVSPDFDTEALQRLVRALESC